MTRTFIALLCAAFVFTASEAAFAQGGRTGFRFNNMEMAIGGKKLADYKGKFTGWLFVDAKPASVKAIKDAVRIHKEYGKNEKFGGFIVVLMADPAGQNSIRQLLKGLPWEVIPDPNGKSTNQAFGVPMDKLPVISMMEPGLAVVWSDQANKYEDELVKHLGVEKAAAPVKPNDPEQAVASMLKAIEIIKDRGEYTPAAERLAGLTPKMLDDPSVMVAATQVVMLMKLEKERAKGVERALENNPKAKTIIRTISRKALVALNAPLPGENARATPNRPTAPSAGNTRDALANRKLNAAEDLQLDSRDMEAYEQFKDIASRYGGTDAAKVATQHIADYEADPDFMKKYNAEAGEEKAQALLRMARNYKQAGRTTLVRKTIADLLSKYPDSAAAREAKDEGLAG